MQSKASADIFLDTWEFGGHTTSVDSLWAGVPVLTFAGPSLMSRVSSSLLIHLGQNSVLLCTCVFKQFHLLNFRLPHELFHQVCTYLWPVLARIIAV